MLWWTCAWLTSTVRFESSGQHPDESRLPCACRHTHRSAHIKTQTDKQNRFHYSAIKTCRVSFSWVETHRSLRASPWSQSPWTLLLWSPAWTRPSSSSFLDTERTNQQQEGVYPHLQSVKDGGGGDEEESTTPTTDLVVPESLHLLLIGRLSHLEDQWGLTKPEILRGDVTIQEDVDAWGDERKPMLIVKWSTVSPHGPLKHSSEPDKLFVRFWTMF